MRVALKDLVATMPRTASKIDVAPDGRSRGVFSDLSPVEPYVWPNIEAPDGSLELRFPVVLISAPGAMGKSFAAHHVAQAASAIYVDLAQMRVGDGSLTGELTKALGFEQVGAFVHALKRGEASLVLDSTDEALLSAGRENYLAFLGDIWWLLQDAVPANAKSFSLGAVRASAYYSHREEHAFLFLYNELIDNEPALEFQVLELSGILTLRSPVSRTMVITDNAVILRGTDGGIDLGPALTIVAEEVEFAGKSVTAFGVSGEVARSVAEGDDENGSITSLSMITARTVSHDADIKVSARPQQTLLVNWSDLWHQWKPWKADFGTGSTRLSPEVTSQALVCLRRLLTSFKSSVRDDPSISADKLDRVLVGSNPVFQATLAGLMALGVVDRGGALYRLHLETLGGYEFSYNDLRGDDPIKPLRKLLTAVVSQPAFEQFKEAK